MLKQIYLYGFHSLGITRSGENPSSVGILRTKAILYVNAIDRSENILKALLMHHAKR